MTMPWRQDMNGVRTAGRCAGNRIRREPAGIMNFAYPTMYICVHVHLSVIIRNF